MTSCELPRIRITGAGDLIEAVPYLIGFHPAESLVLIGFAGRRSAVPSQVTVTVRVELAGEHPWPELSAALQQCGTTAVVALLMTESFEGDPRSSTWLGMAQASVADELAAAGIELLDCLVATEVRWWSMCCRDEQCCPADGVPRRWQSSAAAAEATYAGLVALPDRQALAATLVGRPGAERERLRPAVGLAENRLSAARGEGRLQRLRGIEIRALHRAADQLSPDGPRLTPRRLARFGVALRDTGIRDALWLAVDGRVTGGVQLWEQLHQQLPVPYDAAPLFLFGWAQWRTGNGTLASMAAERALESDPAYTAASLLLSAVQRGLDPHRTPRLARADGFLGEPLR